MRVAVRKLKIDDIAKLQALVVENFDAIEPGLTVLDARLLLGHATIDVIGVDAAGALVLGAVGFSANEEMLLKAVEAYSWCLEYPESLVRLYPSCQLSEDRPPRLLFVVERMPDAFHRKIKQLGFPEVDCVEIRHLEFDSVAAVYFETLLRLRRHAVPLRAVEPDTDAAPSADPGAETTTSEAVPASPPRLQKLGAELSAASPRAQRAVLGREPAPVVSMVTRQAAVPAPVERPRPAPEPVVLREPEPLASVVAPEPVVSAAPEPVAVVPSLALPGSTIPPFATEGVVLRGLAELSLQPAVVPAAPAPSADPAEAGVSFKDLATALLGAAGTDAAVEAPAVPSLRPAPPVVEPVLELAPAQHPLTLAEPVREPVAAATPALPVVEPAEPIVPADLPPALTVEALVAGAASVSAPASQPEAEAPKPRMGALPQEFEGLKFPNDGVLTRQWMEFLNQMSGNK